MMMMTMMMMMMMMMMRMMRMMRPMVWREHPYRGMRFWSVTAHLGVQCRCGAKPLVIRVKFRLLCSAALKDSESLRLIY